MVLSWFRKEEEEPSSPKVLKPTQPRVRIGELLRADLILVSPPALDKDELIRHLGRTLCERRGLGDPAPLLSRVFLREQGICTTLDTGLSAPHARIDGLEDFVAILGLVPQGLADPKQPDLLIRAMFLFFSPNRQEAVTRHLHLLRGVASLLQPAFIEAMLQEPEPALILELIERAEQGG